MADKKYRKTFTVDGVRYYVRGSTKKELAEKERKLDMALDDIRSRFGMESIKRGSQKDLNVGGRLKQ